MTLNEVNVLCVTMDFYALEAVLMLTISSDFSKGKYRWRVGRGWKQNKAFVLKCWMQEKGQIVVMYYLYGLFFSVFDGNLFTI